uniref:Sco1 n=1 Tax=Rubrivivax gelatinosus TaxID=28068 RepID=Q5GCB5_RUBGE|nr:Sco1 [Rubrivivax gelatinosus]
MLAVAAVCAAPVLASYLAFYVVRPAGAPRAGMLVQPPRELPADLSLSGLDGRPVAPASLRGQWLLVVVAPSSCGEACERRLFLQRQLREMLGRERGRVDKLWLLPDAGRPAPALQAAVEAAPAVTLLRADAAALARWLGPAEAEDALLVVDPMGREMMRLPAGADPSLARRDLERLLRASSFWDRPGR